MFYRYIDGWMFLKTNYLGLQVQQFYVLVSAKKAVLSALKCVSELSRKVPASPFLLPDMHTATKVESSCL